MELLVLLPVYQRIDWNSEGQRELLLFDNQANLSRRQANHPCTEKCCILEEDDRIMTL
jgi:hypothetical protein